MAGVIAILFVAALLIHAWVGLRDVTLDYVALHAPRIVVLFLIALSLLSLAAWTVQILWMVRG